MSEIKLEDDVKQPICPLLVYFEGDESKELAYSGQWHIQRPAPSGFATSSC